jgi:hypothetical protein
MVTFYFLLGFLFIGYELYVLINPHKVISKRYIKDEYGGLLILDHILAIHFLYAAWSFVGLIFSNQKLLFLSLLLLGIVTGMFRKNKSPKQLKDLIIMDAMISIIIMSIILYRHFIVSLMCL